MSLDDYLGRVSLTPEEQFKSQERDMLEIAAQCMREQGFDYKPLALEVEQFDAVDRYSLEYVEQWGLGISSELLPDVMADQYGLQGFSTSTEQDVVLYDTTGLSDADAAAFERAINGPDGCFAVAESQAFSLEPDAFEAEFADDIGRMYEKARSSREMETFLTEVQSCLAAEGAEFGSLEEAKRHFQRRADDYGDLIELVVRGDGLDEETVDSLDRLQRDERKAATLVFECNGWDHHEREVVAEVVAGLEVEFIESNRERLEDLGLVESVG